MRWRGTDVRFWFQETSSVPHLISLDRPTPHSAASPQGEALACRECHAKAFPFRGRWHGGAVTDEALERKPVKYRKRRLQRLHLTTACGGASPQGETYARRQCVINRGGALSQRSHRVVSSQYTQSTREAYSGAGFRPRANLIRFDTDAQTIK